MDSFAGPKDSGPPVPAGRVPSPPPGLPIDDYNIAATIITILFGIYLINEYGKKQKFQSKN